MWNMNNSKTCVGTAGLETPDISSQGEIFGFLIDFPACQVSSRVFK